MINVNLLPPEIKAEIAQSKRNRKMLGYFRTTLLILVLAALPIATSWYFLNQQIKASETLLSKSKERMAFYEAGAAKAAKVNQKVNTIKKILDANYKWSGLIMEIQSVTPDSVTLSNIKIDPSPKNRNVISGTAATKKAVAELRDLMEQSEKFDYVDIESSVVGTDPTTRKEGELFTITFSLKPGALK
jgi:Tfp pilus assembly protein PilN